MNVLEQILVIYVAKLFGSVSICFKMIYDLTVSFDNILNGSLNPKQLPVIFKFNSPWEHSGICEKIWINLMRAEK